MKIPTTNFQLPSVGTVQAVLAEVTDLGLIETTWNGQSKVQHKCILTWEIDEEMNDGRRMIVSRRFTASMAENSNLRKMLEGWRGRKFTAEELKDFDTDNLIGVNGILTISHNTTGDRTYANVEQATQLMKGMTKMTVSEDFVPYAERVARREANQQKDQYPSPLRSIAGNDDGFDDAPPSDTDPILPDEDQIAF